MDDKYTVEDTNADAMASKLSAVRKGYFEDEFANEFVREQGKRDIIIHRGYWGRVNMFTILIERFLALSSGRKQIISLGCGYDTHYYSLRKSANWKDSDFHYIEIDLPNVIKNKIRHIEKSQKIKSVIGEYKLDGKLLNLLNGDSDSQTIAQDYQAYNKSELFAKNYSLYPSDLTQIEDFKQKLTKCGVDFSLPTFIFAECVLSYIESKYTDELLSSIASSFDICYVSSYEMYNPNDPFGKMMVKNFERKGCPLVGMMDYPTLEAQQNRLKKLGFTSSCEVYSMLDIYNKYTDQTERKRIERIEMMDEFEEWNIMQTHYFMSLASKISPTAASNPNFTELIANLKIHLPHH